MLGLTWKPFTEEEEKKLLQCIVEAEQNTSGEIRIHLDKWCKSDVVFKANNLFLHLGMDKTELHNGVLIYVAVNEHKFAIVGDKGINAVVPENFWESTKEKMKAHFVAGNLVEGICSGIKEAGEQLKQYFPYQEDDENELPNEISYG
jgi:uncharacterized membrane protein